VNEEERRVRRSLREKEGRRERKKRKRTYGDESSLQEVTSGSGASLGLGVAIGDSGLREKGKEREEKTIRRVLSHDRRCSRKREDSPSARASWRQGQRRYQFLEEQG